MAETSRKTRLASGSASFDRMIKRFGIVTVMNAKVYEPLSEADMKDMDAQNILSTLEVPGTELCTLDTLKVANVTVEGPSKTVTGGQYSNPLIKFGKSARLEMQDALGNYEALEALCGTVSETNMAGGDIVIHNTEDFSGPKTIVGESFFIEQETGEQVKVKVIFYQFLPDSIFNLTQDAEGDATVFDMNGDLLTTTIKTYDKDGTPLEHGVFYSILAEDTTSVGNKSMKVGDVELIKATTVTSSAAATVAVTELVAGKEFAITAKEAGKSTLTIDGDDENPIIVTVK